MGRWRNGTPVHENPDDDDNTALHKSNNFDYEPREVHDKCPFAAHTRKMRPRADLSHDHSVILRRGIPYGPEVSESEKIMKKSSKDRGLLFACYQSDLRNGFNFLTTREFRPTSSHSFLSNQLSQAGPATTTSRAVSTSSSASADQASMPSWDRGSTTTLLARSVCLMAKTRPSTTWNWTAGSSTRVASTSSALRSRR